MKLTTVMFREVSAADLRVRSNAPDVVVAIGGDLSLYFDDRDEARAFFDAGLDQLDALPPTASA